MYDESLKLATRIVFSASLILTLIEIIYFYCQKVRGENLEVDTRTQKPFLSESFARGFGFLMVILTAAAVIVGLSSFDEQGCQDIWFVDEENICKSCQLYFG